MIESQQKNTTECEGATPCAQCQEMSSAQPATTKCTPEKAGYTSAKYETVYKQALKRAEKEDKEIRKNPSLLTANPTAHAMMIGTLLGDGCIVNPECFWYEKRFVCRHCVAQKDYLAAKASLLLDLTPNMWSHGNNGFGGAAGSQMVSVHTKCSQAIEYYWALCYSKPEVKEDGTVRMTKYVTQGWVDQLTWEAVAWWIQDDGALSNNQLTIFTNSFSEEEVGRLIAWFRKNGMKKGTTLEKRYVEEINTTYNLIRFNTAATRAVIEKIKPYVHEVMMYKTLVDKNCETCVCEHCGKEFKTTTNRAASMKARGHVFCKDCQPEVEKMYKQRYEEKIGQDELRARWRQSYENRKSKAAEYRKEYYKENKESISARARARRQGVDVENAVTEVEATCKYCGKKYKMNMKTYALQKRYNTFVCGDPECRRKKGAEAAARSRANLKARRN